MAAVIWQKVKLDGYTESNSSAATLGHGDQDMNSTVGRIGWQARFDGGNVKPYVQVTYEHEFKVSKQASAWLQTMPEADMRKVPGLEFNRDYVTAALGARRNLWGLQSHIGISSTALQKRASGATLFASFSGSFQVQAPRPALGVALLVQPAVDRGVVWRLRQSDRRAPSDVLVVDRYGISDQRR